MSATDAAATDAAANGAARYAVGSFVSALANSHAATVARTGSAKGNSVFAPGTRILSTSVSRRNRNVVASARDIARAIAGSTSSRNRHNTFPKGQSTNRSKG